MFYPAQIFDNVNFIGGPVDVAYGKYTGGFMSCKLAAHTQMTLNESTKIRGPAVIADVTAILPPNTQLTAYEIQSVRPHMNIQYQCCRGELAKDICGEYSPANEGCSAFVMNLCQSQYNMGRVECQDWCTIVLYVVINHRK
jgi:hypothetical protein